MVRQEKINHLCFVILLISFLTITTWCAADAACGRLNWSKLPYHYVADYADHPTSSDATLVFLGTGRMGKIELGIRTRPSAFNDKNSARYFFTSDSGEHWKAKPNPIASNLGTRALFLEAPSDPRVLYRVNQSGEIYLRSEDKGHSWAVPKYVLNGKPKEVFAQEIGGSKESQIQVSLMAIHPKKPKTLFASIKIVHGHPSTDWHNTNFVYQSLDGGESWTEFSRELDPFPNSIGSSGVIGINPYSTNVYFGSGKDGLLKSFDSGSSWYPVGQRQELAARPVYQSEVEGGPRVLGAPVSIDIYQFGFDPQRTETVYIVSNKGLFKSDDGGATWRLLDLGFDEIDSIHGLAVNPLGGQELYVGTRYGVFRSEDGGCAFKKIYPSQTDLRKWALKVTR